MGRWIPSEPGDAGPDREPNDAPVLETIDGTDINDDEIKSVTVTLAGQPTGRAVFSDSDQKERQEYLEMDGLAEWFSSDPVVGQKHGAARPVPWKGRKAYFFKAHGGPGVTELVQLFSGKKAAVRGKETGGFLKRRPSLE